MGIRAGLGRGVGSAKSAWGSQRAQNIRGGAKTAAQKGVGVAKAGASLMGSVASGIKGGIASKKASGPTFFVIHEWVV